MPKYTATAYARVQYNITFEANSDEEAHEIAAELECDIDAWEEGDLTTFTTEAVLLTDEEPSESEDDDDDMDYSPSPSM